MYRPRLKETNHELFPEYCRVIADISGDWSLEMSLPIIEEYRQGWSNLKLESILLVKTFQETIQEYEVYDITPDTSDNTITVTARPIGMAIDSDYILEINAENLSAEDVADILSENTNMTISSDISKASDFKITNRNLLGAIFDDDGFIDTYGGEVYYDNNHVYINEYIGRKQTTLRAEFGYNLTKLIAEESTETLCTRIIPLAYNDRKLPEVYVDSERIDNYRRPYTKFLQMYDLVLAEDMPNSEESYDDEYSLEEAMRSRCEEIFETGIDTPKIKYTINILQVQSVEGYEHIKDIMTARLGDTILCKHKPLGIEVSQRVIKMTWDCLHDEPIEIIIGDPDEDMINSLINSSKLSDSLGEIVNGGSIIADKIQGVIDLRDVNLKAQLNVAEKSDVRAILFEDVVPGSSTYGAMSIGTQGLQIAKNRTVDGSEWDWGTAIDFQSVNADFINTGVISDPSGKNFWDMVSGLVQFDNLRLNTEQVVFAWNSYSDFLQFRDNALWFYNNGLVAAKLSQEGLLIYDNGNYYDGYFGRSDNSEGQSAIGIHMGNRAQLMGMFLEESNQSRTVWTYAKSTIGSGDSQYVGNRLAADADVDMRNNVIRRAKFADCDISGLGISGGATGRIYITAIVGVDQWGQPTQYEDTQITVDNGRITDWDQW